MMFEERPPILSLNSICEHNRKLGECRKCSGKTIQALEASPLPKHTTRGGVGVVGVLSSKKRKP
jgi:hypothetical protein